MGGEVGGRDRAEEFSRGWNRAVSPRVIQDVGRKRTGRGLVAAVVAVGVVLAGCGAGGDGDTTTSSPVAEGPANPWDLPLEERPPLFDPCAEISTELVEEAVGASMEPNGMFHNNQVDALKSCGWSNDEVMITVLSTWKSYNDYMDDTGLSVIVLNHDGFARPALQMSTANSRGERRCHTLFFTEIGTIMINLSLGSAIREFDGELLSEACVVSDEIGQSVVDTFPKGDFR